MVLGPLSDTFACLFRCIPNPCMPYPFFNPLSARKSLENRSNLEDDRITHLEEQLSQARALAEEADRKYEEVQ